MARPRSRPIHPVPGANTVEVPGLGKLTADAADALGVALIRAATSARILGRLAK